MERVKITDDDTLYRRIHPHHIKPDGIVTSAAFKGNGSDELSVDLACEENTPQDTVQRGVQMGVACVGVGAISAGDARAEGQEVVHDPLGEGELGGPNPYHSLIKGKKTDPIAKRLASKCHMVYSVMGPFQTPR